MTLVINTERDLTFKTEEKRQNSCRLLVGINVTKFCKLFASKLEALEVVFNIVIIVKNAIK